MVEKDFIINELTEFSKKNAGLKISYVFDESFSQHVFEVIPESIYNSEEFANKQNEFEMKLINKFPQIEILFVTEGHDLILPKFEFIIGEQTSQKGILSNPFSFELNLGALTGIFYTHHFFNTNILFDLQRDMKEINCSYINEFNINIPIVKTEGITYYGGGEGIPVKVSSSFENLNIPVSPNGIKVFSNENEIKVDVQENTVNNKLLNNTQWNIPFFPIKTSDKKQEDPEENSFAMAA